MTDTLPVDLPARRQHPAWIFLSALRQLRGLALPLVVLLVSGSRRGDEGWPIVVGLALVVLGLLNRAVAWWQFRYEISNGELRVFSGLLERRERFVPLERIQAVDVDETPLQRLFGVVGVRIETASGGERAADVTLQAVTRAEADDLRRRLAVAHSTAPGPRPAAAPTTAASTTEGAVPSGAGLLIRRITPGELLLAGATSGRIGPALAIVAFAYRLLVDLVPQEYWEGFVARHEMVSLPAAISVVVVVGIGAWLLAIAGTALTFAGFELWGDGERLMIAYGLLDRRRRTVPLARIQAVAVGEGLLRRPFGLATVRFESAGFGRGAAESGVLFPLLRTAEVPALLAAAAPAFASPAPPVAMTGPPPRARRRYLLADVWWILGLAVLAFAVAAVAPWWSWRWGLLPLLAIPFAVVNGWLQYRDAGWAIDPLARLVVRTGGWSRTTTIIPRRRLQRRSIIQNVLQRRAALASFSAAVASHGHGGRVGLKHLDADLTMELIERLGPAPRSVDAPPRVLTGAPVAEPTA